MTGQLRAEVGPGQEPSQLDKIHLTGDRGAGSIHPSWTIKITPSFRIPSCPQGSGPFI